MVASSYIDRQAALGARVNPGDWGGVWFLNLPSSASPGETFVNGSPASVGAGSGMAWVNRFAQASRAAVPAVWEEYGRTTTPSMRETGPANLANSGASEAVATAATSGVAGAIGNVLKSSAVRLALVVLGLLVVAVGLWKVIK